VSQGKYAREILGKFHMEGYKPMDTPLPGNWKKEDATSVEVVDAIVYRQLVGSLMYLVNTRPDIFYAVNQCWLWSLIIFLIQRSFTFSRVYTP
jgi:hypothetical protein